MKEGADVLIMQQGETLTIEMTKTLTIDMTKEYMNLLNEAIQKI